MAYNVKYRASVNTNTVGNTDSHVIEILKRDYTGSVIEVTLNAGEGGFKQVYENLDPKKIYDKPIQKSRLELYLQCRGEGTDSQLGYDGLGILQEIFAADETEFLMQRKLNGSVVWKGWVLPDLLEYPDGEYAFSGKIIAKDFTRLSGIDISTASEKIRVIELIGEILNTLNLDRSIYSHTAWSELSFADSADFLHEIHVPREHLRKFSDDPDKNTINAEKALEFILRNFGLILRQSRNGFSLYQLSALQDASAVRQYSYGQLGENGSNDGDIDYTYSGVGSELYLQPNGTNQVNPALKSARLSFENADAIDTLTEYDGVLIFRGQDTEGIEGRLDPYTFQQDFINTGFQHVYIKADSTGNVYFEGDDEDSEIKIKVGDYYYNGFTGNWAKDSNNSYKVNYDRVGSTVDGRFEAEIDFITASPIPADAGNIIEIIFDNAFQLDGGSVRDFAQTKYFNFDSGFTNNANEIISRSTVNYKLEQQDDFSTQYDYDNIVFADGPTEGASSALQYYFDDEYIITRGQWGYKGGAKDYLFSELVLKELLNLQRIATRNISANMMGNYDPSFLLQHKGGNLFFIGGEVSGYNYRWNGKFLDVQFNQSSNDTFSEVLDKDSSSGSGSSGGSGGSGGGNNGGGLNPDVADSRYLNEDSNLSDITSKEVARDNLSVYGKDESDNRFLQIDNNLSELDIITGEKNFDSTITGIKIDIISDEPDTATFDGIASNKNSGMKVLADRNSNAYIALGDQDKFNRGRLLYKNASDTLSLFAAGNEQLMIDDDKSTFNNKLTAVNQRATIKDLLIQEGITLDDLASFIQSQTFVGDFVGEGFQLKKDEQGKWKLTTDDIVIRNSAKIYELIVTQLQAFAQFLLTEGHKVEGVEQVGASFSWGQAENPFAPGATNAEGLPYSWANKWKCYIPEDKLMQLAINDLLLRQDFDGRNVGSNEATVIAVEKGDIAPTVNDPRRTFTVYLQDDSAVPLEGWQFARSGNRTNPDRQGGLYFVGSGDDAPYTRIYDGVDRHSKFGKMETIISQDGKLDNLVIPEFDDLDGTQNNLYGEVIRNAYVSGKINVTGGNAATMDYVDSQTAGDGLRDELNVILDDAILNGTTIIEGGFIKSNFLQIGNGVDYESGYDPSTKETPTGAQAKVNSLQGDIDSAFDNAIADGNTIIVNGFIETDFIDVDELLAQNATISATLTIEDGAGAQIVSNGSVTKTVLHDGGISAFRQADDSNFLQISYDNGQYGLYTYFGNGNRASSFRSDGIEMFDDVGQYTAKFSHNTNPILGVQKTDDQAGGGGADPLPSNPAMYIPMTIQDKNTGTSYNIRIPAYGVVDTTPPSIPNQPNVVRESGTGLTLTSYSINEPTDFSYYKIYRSNSSSGTFLSIGTTESTSYTDTTAIGGGTKYYRVSAVDVNGNESNKGPVGSGTY